MPAMAVLLLGAELFLCFHGVRYFLSVIKAQRHLQQAAPLLFAAHGGRPTRHDRQRTRSRGRGAVAAFNESADVLEETLASVRAMDYPAAHIYLIDERPCLFISINL